MDTIRVRTGQHISMLHAIENSGRCLADPKYVCSELSASEDTPYRRLVMRSYDRLAEELARRLEKPGDASYPIWVSPGDGSGFPPPADGVTMYFDIPKDRIAFISMEKWSAVLDYRYIPKDGQDAKKHREMLKMYGISDAKAMMTGFYPEIKREILSSWHRVFDTDGLSEELCFGLVWELRKEWLVKAVFPQA